MKKLIFLLFFAYSTFAQTFPDVDIKSKGNSWTSAEQNLITGSVVKGDLGVSTNAVRIISSVGSDTAYFRIIDGGANPDTLVAEGTASLAFRWANSSIVVDKDTVWINGTRFEINSGINVVENNACIRLEDNSGNYSRIKTGDSQLTLEVDPDNAVASTDMVFKMDGSEVARFFQGGNFGLGTTTPSSIFHVKANLPGTVGSHYAGQIIIQNPADDTTSGVVITAYESDGSGNPDQQLWYLGSASTSNEDITLLNRRSANLTLGTSGATRVTVSGAGDVGIGISNPSEKLEVNGAVIAKNGFATKLWDVIGGHFETAVVNTEYYSPNQNGGIYGTIYRQYFNTVLTSTNPRLDTGNNVTGMIDYSIQFKYTGDDRGLGHGNATAYGSSDNHIYVMLGGASGAGNLVFAPTGYTIQRGWIDYTK